MSNDTDQRLAERCLAGDLRAFEELVARYERTIFNSARSIVRDYDDACDVTQSTFLKAYESLSQYRPEHKFFSWLYRIAVNEAMKMVQKRDRHVELDERLATTTGGPAENYEQTELAEQLEDSMMDLNTPARVILVLRHFAELSYRELSYVLDLPEPTVKSRLFEARRSLSKLLLKRGILANE